MRISILCSSDEHPINVHLERWIVEHAPLHEIELVRRKKELNGGDILFLISSGEIITLAERNRYKKTLVIHASDVPRGRGWSPHIWEIISGAEMITVSMLEAEDMVDSGAVWKKIRIPIPKHFLWNEINDKLFNAEIELISFAVDNFSNTSPQFQDSGIQPNYYRKRKPEDSRIDIDRSIACQFDLIRVCDPNRFPAFFEIHGHRYKITLEKYDDQQ